MEPSSLAELQHYFIRPASITTRYTDENEVAYREAATAYSDLLLPTTRELISQQREAASYYFYQFRVNKGTSSTQDIELRLEHRTRDIPDLQNRTIIYWKIDDDKLVIIKEKLLSLHYQLLEEDNITVPGKEAKRFIAKSPTGNLIAGHTNPPFPFMSLLQQAKQSSDFTSTGSSNTYLLTGISLAVVLVGAAVLFRRWW